MPIWTCLSTELSEVKSILQQLKHELANRSTASREHTHFHTCLIGGILFMRIQTALLLRLDTDHPRIFPRHPEMAVKWKHLISVFMLVLSLYSLSISRVKKKKKDLWLIVFWRMLLPLQFFKLFLDKIFSLFIHCPLKFFLYPRFVYLRVHQQTS